MMNVEFINDNSVITSNYCLPSEAFLQSRFVLCFFLIAFMFNWKMGSSDDHKHSSTDHM